MRSSCSMPTSNETDENLAFILARWAGQMSSGSHRSADETVYAQRAQSPLTFIGDTFMVRRPPIMLGCSRVARASAEAFLKPLFCISLSILAFLTLMVRWKSFDADASAVVMVMRSPAGK